MQPHTTLLAPQSESVLAAARWTIWQARGAASDLRSGRIMTGLFAAGMTLLVGWLVVQLV